MTYRTYREQKWWAMTDEERRDALKGELLGYKRAHFFDTGYVYAPYTIVGERALKILTELKKCGIVGLQRKWNKINELVKK